MMATNETINHCIALLHAQPYGNRPKGGTELIQLRDVWRAVFADMPDDMLQAATVQTIAAGGEFWPLASTIRKAAAALVGQADGVTTAEQAWAELVYRFRTGAGAPLEGELDPPTRAALRMVGGWQALAMATRDEMISHRARFIDAYRDHRDGQTAVLLQPPAVTAYVEARRERALLQMRQVAAQLGAGGSA